MARSRWRRSTALRCATWWRSFPPATRCRSEVVEDVAARTGGVPLFVEEVTRLLLERGEQGGIQAIPPTLQQSLMARLDRLGPAREVAQIGAVIGRGFSYGLLRAVAGMDDGPLQMALEKLAEADILLVQGLPPETDYRFKHALIQDAAYENLLKSRRQVLHRRVAEILRDRFADTAAAEPEALAHHFTQAGLTDAAIEWWGKAGDQALRRSAFQEAISHLGKAIEMADKAGERRTRRRTAAAPPRPEPTAEIADRLWPGDVVVPWLCAPRKPRPLSSVPMNSPRGSTIRASVSRPTTGCGSGQFRARRVCRRCRKSPRPCCREAENAAGSPWRLLSRFTSQRR